MAQKAQQSSRPFITSMVFAVIAAFSVLAENPQKLTAIFETPIKEGGARLGFNGEIKETNHPDTSNRKPLFFAVSSHSWPTGLAPIYQTRQKDGTMKLTRRLTHGRENFVEPLFFALPLKEESHVAEISGRWSCEATHLDGSVDFLHWEITLVENSIVGRFDQYTDYRFAWFMEGQFSDPDVQLNAEYIDAKYQLIGKLSKGQFEGTWRHLEGGDGGTWRAEPVNPVTSFDPPLNTAPLYVITHEKHNQQTWQVGGEKPDHGTALCLVWLPEPGPAPIR